MSICIPNLVQMSNQSWDNGCLYIYGSSASDLPEHMQILDRPWRLLGDLHLVTRFYGDPICHFEIIAIFCAGFAWKCLFSVHASKMGILGVFEPINGGWYQWDMSVCAIVNKCRQQQISKYYCLQYLYFLVQNYIESWQVGFNTF